MSDITITSSGTTSSYTLSTFTNGQNITFSNDGGTDSGVLILTDAPLGSAFNTGTHASSTSYFAYIGGTISNFQPPSYGIGGDQITIQAVKDLFAELMPGGTANPDYIGLVNDITAAGQSGGHIFIEPSGTVFVPTSDNFTLDAAQDLVIQETGAALFGTAAAAAGATLDFAFNERQNPNSDNKIIDMMITTDVAINPCFAKGTRILTTLGEVAVEDLQPGDILITHSGDEAPVVWIGQRKIDIIRHRQPGTVRPIFIEADALADGVPYRRLVISPDHALYIDGVLVPAKELLNWTSIRQDTAALHVIYYHVELESHGVIFADGAPAESYLDTGHRSIFDNAESAVIAHPVLMQQRREAESCAPLCLGGPALAAIRSRIASRQIGIRLG